MNILKVNCVLEGPNYCGLRQESTKTPIHILHNAMEDARSSNKEMWILLQDMSKAFDSVGLTPLRAALNRIQLKESCTNFLIDLFD